MTDQKATLKLIETENFIRKIYFNLPRKNVLKTNLRFRNV